MDKNYLTYPTKYMNITQNYNGKYSHLASSLGKSSSYPIDEACENEGKSWFYACCDELVVKRIYGVGNRGANTIWLESSSKVVTPSFTDYITMMIIHPNDDSLNKIKVNQKFKRGNPIFQEGTDGYATGNHFHIEIARGKFNTCKNMGWIENSKGAWVLSGNTYKPEACFYIDNTFTKVVNSCNLKFKNISTTIKPISKPKKQYLYLPKTASSWRVYPTNKKPIVGNECGNIKPKKFGGLKYEVIGKSIEDVVTIQTKDYGKVNIYVGKETGAIIK